MNRINMLAAAALVVVATACGNTADGVEKDAENMGDRAGQVTERAADGTANATESVGSSMGAAMETADVKSSLLADTRLSAGDINVDTNNDTKTVTLNGTVPTEAEKKIAEEVAVAKATGYTVVNNLTIKAK